MPRKGGAARDGFAGGLGELEVVQELGGAEVADTGEDDL